MARLKDYGIRIISHGEWSDPEIEWEKSKFQKLLFNYWDVAECPGFESLDLTKDEDLQELVYQLNDLHPSSYERPLIDYEWEICDGNVYESYDDNDYYKDARLSTKDDFILHTKGQALRQALQAIDDVGEKDCEIRIYRFAYHKSSLVAHYRLQGSTLKDLFNYI